MIPANQDKAAETYPGHGRADDLPQEKVLAAEDGHAGVQIRMNYLERNMDRTLEALKEATEQAGETESEELKNSKNQEKMKINKLEKSKEQEMQNVLQDSL